MLNHYADRAYRGAKFSQLRTAIFSSAGGNPMDLKFTDAPAEPIPAEIDVKTQDAFYSKYLPTLNNYKSFLNNGEPTSVPKFIAYDFGEYALYGFVPDEKIIDGSTIVTVKNRLPGYDSNILQPSVKAEVVMSMRLTGCSQGAVKNVSKPSPYTPDPILHCINFVQYNGEEWHTYHKELLRATEFVEKSLNVEKVKRLADDVLQQTRAIKNADKFVFSKRKLSGGGFSQTSSIAGEGDIGIRKWRQIIDKVAQSPDSGGNKVTNPALTSDSKASV